MSTSTELHWKLEHLGRWSEPATFEVTRERIVAYAEATNDEHLAHRSGDLAPPVFPVVAGLLDVLAPAIIEIVPGEVVMRIVHGEHDFRYHQPIVPGQTLLTRGAPIGVRETSSGVVVLGKAVTETKAGDPVVEQYMAAFFRGAQMDPDGERGSGESLTEHAFDESLRASQPVATVTHSYDPDQTHRYSEASGDPMPIHLDGDFAKAMGLPGIIVHGLCTMAFCSRAVVGEFCAEDPTRLKRLAVRFSKIVQPNETVTHSLWDAGNGRVRFETTSDNGNVAIRDGLAEIGG
jgi:acyl dehydratase